jgi:hypothetical protein
MLRHMLIRFRLARRAGRSIFVSLVFALRTPPKLRKQTEEENRARLKELKNRWHEGG